MKKIIVLFFIIAIFCTWSIRSASGHAPTAPGYSAIPYTGVKDTAPGEQRVISEQMQEPPLKDLTNESRRGTQDQNFYKMTVQAYKDFNEQIVKYLSIALAIASALATILGAFFLFVFSKTLSEIRNDLKRDADRLREVYSRTFDLLNEQARTNLEIFRSRESDLKTTIVEGKELNEQIKSTMKEISNNQIIREPVAEDLAQKEVTKVEEKRKEVKEEVENFKKDLKPLTEENGNDG